MRREIKLIIWVFVLVVGPALALSFLAARVLESWQIVLQKRMAGEAGRVLEEAVVAWDHELATLRAAAGAGFRSRQATHSRVVQAASLSMEHPWGEGVYVFKAGSGLLYPATESGRSQFERTGSSAAEESFLHQGGTSLERGDTNGAISFLERVDSNQRDPEEGFFCDLIALRKLMELYVARGETGRVAAIQGQVMERVLGRYDEMVPLQRESVVAWLEGAGQSVGPAGMRAQWQERLRARRLGQAERTSLADGFQMFASNLPDEGWVKVRLNQADFIIARISGVRGDSEEPERGASLVLALKINEPVLIRHLNTLFAGTVRHPEIRVQCQAGSTGIVGPILASRPLSAPFGSIPLVATPENVPAFLANVRLQAWLYRGGGMLLLMSVVAGVWLLWREAACEIRQARERSDFAATVSHDLRTPLSSMRMLAESLYMGNVTDEGKRKKFLGAIIKESDRLSRLTDRALYFIRYGQGALRYQFTEGDLGGVVKEVVESFAVGVGGQVAVAGAGSRVSEDEKAQIVLGIKIAPDLPPVRFDVGAMEQVLYNLLDNALKYSRKEEAVQIRVELVVEAGHVVLSVQDQGVGMSPDEVRRILKPYVRGRNAGRQNARGIGLGLALCQHVVQAHGGRIQIQSEPGKGSKFCILLPG
jgi:signal transduction histidine kinase